MRDMEDFLYNELLAMSSLVYPIPRVLIEEGAALRLEQLASAAPTAFFQLVEPWQEELSLRGKALETVRLCTHIHMYTRILDDALDENLPCRRKALLRIQPDFWEAVFKLGKMYPDSLNACRYLIEETINAVLIDDNIPSPDSWGRKNHHLLIAPLLLGGERLFASCKAALSHAILISQTLDELRQGVFHERFAIYANIVRDFIEGDEVKILFQHGWNILADNCLLQCREIASRLQNYQDLNLFRKL